jgi:hypothetical protein
MRLSLLIVSMPAEKEILRVKEFNREARTAFLRTDSEASIAYSRGCKEAQEFFTLYATRTQTRQEPTRLVWLKR